MTELISGRRVEICLGDLQGSYQYAVFRTAPNVSRAAVERAQQEKGKQFLKLMARKGFFLPSNQPITFSGPYPLPDGDWEWRMRGFFRRERPMKVLRDVALHLEDLYNDAPYDPRRYAVPYVIDPLTGFIKDAIDTRLEPVPEGYLPQDERPQPEVGGQSD